MIYSVVKIQVNGLTFSWFGINPFTHLDKGGQNAHPKSPLFQKILEICTWHRLCQLLRNNRFFTQIYVIERITIFSIWCIHDIRFFKIDFRNIRISAFGLKMIQFNIGIITVKQASIIRTDAELYITATYNKFFIINYTILHKHCTYLHLIIITTTHITRQEVDNTHLD